MRWSSAHGGLAGGSSGSLTSRFERLVSLQGASDSMAHFSPKGVVMISASGIAVLALLLATSLTLTMVIPLAPGRFCLSLPFSGWFSVLKVLVLKCRVLPFSWALTLLAWCLGLRGSCLVVTLPGVPLWFFRTWLGLGGAPPDIRRACFLSDCTLQSWPRPRLGVLGIPCLGFRWLSFRERVGCPLLSSWL